MANIGLNFRTRNDENGHDVPLRSKQMVSNEVPLVKKQVFGELKNVMHSQHIGLTPIKGNAAKIDGLSGKFGASSSLCNDVLRKQQLKQNFLDAQKKLEQKYKTNSVVDSYKEPIFDEELFDSWDYNRKCCQSQKREEEIWAEMDLERLNVKSTIFCCAADKDEMNTCYKLPSPNEGFDDFEKDLIPSVPDFDFIIETGDPEICEMPSLLNYFEDLEL